MQWLTNRDSRATGHELRVTIHDLTWVNVPTWQMCREQQNEGLL